MSLVSLRPLARVSLLLAVLFSLSSLLRAQIIEVTNEVRSVSTLASGATATLTGRAELHVTGAGDPTAGATINLNSPDAWLFFPALRPSVVQSTQLPRVLVNGTVAVHGTNCRVVQYALGTVVIPHAPTFQPLQAFVGPNFTGASSSFSQYTYYNSAGTLGVLNRAISSFKLKRGYMATLSTQTGGAGPARVYVAQDGDLEIGRLPAELDDSVVFVRVLPWRWVGKKGSCDVAADTLNASWFYNWDNNQNSSLNWEYVPIRQQRWWPGYPTDKSDSTHLLGYNEPDNPVEDSYTSLGAGSIDTAIAVWPELLATGLRVGSPAVTDGGESWLYSFMDKAAAAKLRVDYVAIHFYRCGYTATQLRDWLYNIHVRTGKPIWITEFNNGANWTSCADPSYADNATRIAEFIDMMDNEPWIERYAVYSRVEAVRQMTYDEGGLTPAGVVYRDNTSPIGYRQEVPATGGRGVARLTFDDTVRDASGHSNHGLAVSAPRFVDGVRGRAIELDGATQAVQLPANVAAASAFSFAGWVYWDGGANWQRIFDFGDDTSRYLFLTPSSGSGTLRFAIRNAGSEQIVETAAALPVGQWTHVAVTLSGGVGRIYLNGVQAASAAVSITPSQFTPTDNYLGKSQFAADPLFDGRLDDVYIADYAFSAAQVAALMTDTPPQFTNATITGAAGVHGQLYSGTFAGAATDADAGDTLTYAKLSGPAWLSIAADGTFSGTPTYGDSGLQSFVVSVTDSAGASASAVFAVSLPTVVGNGSWGVDLDGAWSESARWASAFPANGAGQTANFSLLNITADRTVTLDGSRPVGTLRFGDTSGAQSWTLASSGGAALTMDAGSTTPGSVVVVQNTATITATLAGSQGLAKTGPGTLVLAGENSLSGPLTIDTGSTTDAEGVVRLAHPAASAFSSILIRNNNSGSSALELSGASGGVVASAPITLSGRTNSAVALRNLNGDNTLSGTLTLQVGGSFYGFQSDAGTLTLGALTSAATGTRTITFQGAGNFTVGGVASNGSATGTVSNNVSDNIGLGFGKNGSGTLALTAANTATGNVTVNAGTLSILGSGALYAGAYNPSSTVTINSGATLELDRWGYGPAGAYRTQALGGLAYAAARLVLNGGTIRYTGGAAGAPLNPSESPYGPGFTIGALGATLEAAKISDTWTVKNDSRGTGPVVSAAGGTLTLSGVGNGLFDKVLPGTGGLIKTGAGIWTLPLANTYTGATTIQAGVLRITGSTASGMVTAQSSGTLAGTGTLGGPVTISSGGVIEPGLGGIGTLTFLNNLGLLAGGTTRMEINKSTGARDRLVVSGALALAGKFIVTNLGGTLAAGDSFDLFDAASISGSFPVLELPALAAGLGWDTSALATTGVLRVVSLATFAGWSAAANLPAGQQAATADPDGDGVSNAFEWLLGGDPLSPDTAARQPQHAVRPLTAEEYPAAVEGRSYLTLSARVRRDRLGVTLVPEAATSLEGLALPAAAQSVAPLGAPVIDGDFEVWTYVFTTPLQDSPTGRAFIRLRAVLAP